MPPTGRAGPEVTDAGTGKFLRGYLADLHRFIGRAYTVLPRGTWPCKKECAHAIDSKVR
jgi:hypothetical protein